MRSFVSNNINNALHLASICFAAVLATVSHAATYYVDFIAGSDSNNGTSKLIPWKHAPYMNGFGGSYSHSAGDQFIFKGGTTWDSTCFPINIGAAGSGSVNDYYGVDKTWFNGAAWSKPLFDGQYVAPQIFVLNSISGNITIDNLELCHITCTSNFLMGLISGPPLSNLLVSNCYLHGWRVTTSTDDAHGGVVLNIYGSMSGIGSCIIDSCEIENSENPTRWNGVCVRAMGVIRNSKIHDNSSAVLYCLDFDHNELYNVSYPNSGFDGTYHFNGVYMDPSTLSSSVGYIRNSYLHDVSGGANMAYPNPHGASIYIYNNVMYGKQSAQQAVEIDPYNYGSGGSDGKVYCWNNTIVVDPANYTAIHVVNRNGNPILNTLVAQNNHVIGNASVTDGSSITVTNLTQDHNLVQTVDQATASGYTLSNQYSPAVSNSPTVDAGTNSPASIFSDDILGVSRPQGGAWDIGPYQYVSTSTPTP